MLDHAPWQATESEPVAEAVGETAQQGTTAREVHDGQDSARGSQRRLSHGRVSRVEPLDQYIAARQGPIEVAREVEIIGQLAHELARMHQSGLLHLEVRPSGIRIDAWACTAAFAGEGHAAAVNGSSGRPDRIPGFCDLPYASAEVLAREPADESDDVYAFACVAYELLTGLHPYARRSALDALDGSFQPSVVKGLNERQNTTLLRALEPRRVARRVTMREISSAFGGDAGLSNKPMRVLARKVGPYTHAAITAVSAFVLGIAVHSMWTHFTAPAPMPSAAAVLPPTPWFDATPRVSSPATTEAPAALPPIREPAANEASVAVDGKRIVLASSASQARADSERAADPGADKRADRAADKSPERNAPRQAESTARGTDTDAAKSSAELPASRAAVLQAQASAASACPTCSCPDLGMKRFIAGVSLNWEEANYYLNVCGERG